MVQVFRTSADAQKGLGKALLALSGDLRSIGSDFNHSAIQNGVVQVLASTLQPRP